MRPAILCLLLFFFTLREGAKAQGLPIEQPEIRRHEVSLGYGVLGTPQLVSGLGDVFTFFIFSQNTERHTTGPAIFGYHYRLSQKVSLGFSASYTQLKSRYRDTGENAGQVDYYTFLPRFSYYWARNPAVEVYSGIGLGASYLNRNSNYEPDEPNEFVFTTQLTAMGIRAGRKTGFFMELGLGMNGLLNAGMDRRF
ncbi:hypothetical protein [Pontibacter arcticus]|uniref:Outer membrane protein beta-barrel domain-containing protein n=1 Tax=Pontibacter arcticus TaxID=2080288 RepID=A0A364RFG5_9BACT|nr:hypothetical protein [Pontibacter arcticus]RAU83080.1 hypothetical protein DP923_07565 [Pontibacter arcticus]